jgi:hypothetical protein
MTDARRAHRYLIIGMANPITPSGTGSAANSRAERRADIRSANDEVIDDVSEPASRRAR